MRKLIVTEFVSLNGVLEAPGGEATHPHAGWVFDFMGSEQEQFKLEEVLEADAHLLGRVTYESFAGAWPQRGGEFADKMNSMRKYVVSSTLSEPLEWENSTVITGDVPAEVAKLKQGEGGPILVAGSCSLLPTLIENDLVDEYRMMIFPVFIADGKRLPDAAAKKPLALVETKAFDSGVVVHTYRPAESS